MEVARNVIGLVHLGGAACMATGCLGLAAAVFQIAFNAYVEATAVRAALQFIMIPLGAYTISLEAPPALKWNTWDVTRLVASLALIGAGTAGLSIGSAEMTLHYMPLELWRRMVFYAVATLAGIIISPFTARAQQETKE
jgi:hypothetical protein